MKQILVIIAIVIGIVTGCGKGQVSKPEAKSSGKVEGSLTVNGKTEALKHLYARRVDAKPGYGGEAAINVLLTNQPISDELLNRLFEEMDKQPFERDELVVKGSSLSALSFRISKNQSFKNWGTIRSDGTLVTPEGFIGGRTTHEFQEFDLQKGLLRAKAEKEWEENKLGDGSKRKSNQCSYSLSFEASLGESNVRSAKVEALPDQGTATGMMTSKDGVAIELKYAYAWKERLFFDEPEEKTVVLVTDKPIPRDKKAEVVDEVQSLDRHGVQGLRFMINEFREVYWVYFIAKSDLFNTNSFNNVEWVVENDRVRGKADFAKSGSDTRDFSVTFDAPLKN